MTLSRPEVRRMLASHGLHPSRALGQNFVVDPNTVRRIARLAGVGPGSEVVEVGAGLGSLTLALAETGANVTAVEIDSGWCRCCVPSWSQRVYAWCTATRSISTGPSCSVRTVQPRGPRLSWALVSNLPYNVATPVVAKVLDEVNDVKRLVVMVQREVGERLAAGVGDSAYGAVSVKVAYHSKATLLGHVPPTVFMPRPNVESVIVGMDRHDQPAVDPARCEPRATVRGGEGGLLAPAQDAAPIAYRCRGPRRLRSSRVRSDAEGRGSGRSCVGQTGGVAGPGEADSRQSGPTMSHGSGVESVERTLVGDGVGPGQADAVAAGDRNAGRRAARARRRDGDDRPRGRSHLYGRVGSDGDRRGGRGPRPRRA